MQINERLANYLKSLSSHSHIDADSLHALSYGDPSQKRDELRGQTLENILKMGQHYAQRFLRFPWTILTTDGDMPFITGDTPVAYQNPSQPTTQGIVVTRSEGFRFPLNRTACLYGQSDSGRDGFESARSYLVRNINSSIVRRRYAEVCASFRSDNLQALLHKYPGNSDATNERNDDEFFAAADAIFGKSKPLFDTNRLD